MTGPSFGVCLIAPAPPPLHGSSYAVQLLLKSRVTREFDVCHIDARYAESVAGMGRVQVRKALLMLGYIWRMVREVRQRQVRYVIVMPAFQPLAFLRDSLYILSAAALTRARIVLWSHSSDTLRLYEALPAPARRYMAFVLRRACCVVTLGEVFRPSFERFLAPGRIVVIPNGLPDRPVRERPASDDVRVIFVAHMLRAKGWSDLLRAAELVCDTHPRVQVEFYGAPTTDSPAEAIARAFDGVRHGERIRYRGPIAGDAKFAALDAADIFCLPSHAEALPMAVLEAMQSGLPVIATRVGAIPEAVVEGEGGRLVDVGDVAALAEAIADVADHPDGRRRMGAFNRSRFATTFRLDRVADQWVALLRSLEGVTVEGSHS